jgi:anti-sigma factor RsiW
MKTIEEEIWDYIDGNGTAEEQQSVAAKIEENADYSRCFQELSKLNALMTSGQLEEPSMSFTRNVMDAVALEIAPKALQTRVNNKIILGIAAFFILSLLAILVYAFANSDVSGFTMQTYNTNFHISSYITPTFLKIFLFFDVTLALLYFDRLLRRKNAL